jgi:hypothetical protein
MDISQPFHLYPGLALLEGKEIFVNFFFTERRPYRALDSIKKCGHWQERRKGCEK